MLPPDGGSILPGSIIAPVVQLEERLSCKQIVGGSIPPGGYSITIRV